MYTDHMLLCIHQITAAGIWEGVYYKWNAHVNGDFN